ncbi:MAG: cytochrome c peroxidase [Saprospiraceae bacterium]
MNQSGKYSIFFILILMFAWLSSCQSDQDVFTMKYPDYFPSPAYQFDTNPLSKEGFELGKSLFHDPIMSIDSSISCASCHAQNHAFADHNIALSQGIFSKVGARNSPAIINVAWQTSFMWDGGINHIEIMPFAPITNPVEMGESLENVIRKLENNPNYVASFNSAFGHGPIVSQKIFYALAQYMGMLISDDSKYDRVKKGREKFSNEEQQGYEIFKTKCNSCHIEPMFTDYSFRNNGIIPSLEETGRYKITLDDNDKYKFKVPTLRNISLTYPYMHDGKLTSLRSVLDHYDHGMFFSETLDEAFITSTRLGIPLTEDEKKYVESFLITLTDYTFITNPLYAK